MKQLNDLIADFWGDYAALVLLAGGLLGVILLISFGIWAKRTGKPLRPLALAFSMNLALLLNAEGMWVIAIDQLNLPKIFAVLVFAVFEICFLTATSLAAEQYRRTSVYASDGTIVTPGHPGAMLYIAALIAGLSGVIVASNAATFTEKLLRLAVPCMIFLMWWAALTAAGQRVRRGRFAYSPRRLAERWGWLIPDDDPDLVRMAAERQVRRMVVNYHRVSAGRFPKPWWRSRLLKDARTAGEPVVEEVVEQLARIQRVMDLLVPGAVRIRVPAAAGVPAVTAPSASALLSAGASGPAAEAIPDGPAPAGQVDPAVAPSVPAVPSVQPVRFVQPVEPDPAVPAPSLPAPAEPDSVEAPAAASVAASVEAEETLPEPEAAFPVATVTVPVQRGPVDRSDAVTAVVPVSPAPAPQPAWAATPTGARPAVSIAGSPWWRLAVDRLSKMVAQEITAEDLPEMNYLRINELARKLAPRVSELGEGVVRTFINEYVRELDGEHVESAYPWRDFLPAAAAVPPGSEAWHAALADLRTALEEELPEGQPLDSDELAELLAPSAPRLDEATIRAFISDYVLALSGMPGPGSVQPWAHLLPRPQSVRPASDEDLLEVHGAELFEHLRSTGRLSRYKVQAVTGIKSRVQADRIKTLIEERAAETATA
ncbi:hypothetical protein GCM10010112_58800 [Actinoplanes lobatus]|uniref:Uncharacterized protein n=1 Tax=Actinoplanes lobatus TaxID=113568 RepID=A0A7W7HQC3_9ACTN|nr:MFS transporter [Actinoplanes lobatus]MBB4754768.1 hypothetical protein [Actinoplanes lobatus]GGN81867.1 hypothetical protein GCM10010112_58800 [Actinoplanes lobatus]GIE43099.1 hypothetical protein Alo02nite_59970 [Actinoplanes lobatus]